MPNTLERITAQLASEISDSLSRRGLMFRIFSRVKSESSIRRKLVKYEDKKTGLQDMIGIRIVAYFQDDVDALALYYSIGDVVKKAIDEYEIKFPAEKPEPKADDQPQVKDVDYEKVDEQ